MRVRVYTANNESENHVLQAFYEGCAADDKWIGDLDSYEPSDVAVVFGTYKKQVPISYRRGHVVHEQKRHGLDTVILETGYINRGSGPDNHYAAGLNGLNGRAYFVNEASPPDRAARFERLVKPWRKDGTHILLCGQVPWDASVDHIDFIKWTQDTASMLTTLSGRPIIYRSHPLVKTPTPWGASRSVKDTLAEDLENCWCVVTFNSNSGVEAVLNGIPAVAMDAGSMIMGVETNIGQVESPRMPNRQQWLNDLCYSQWTPEEMRKGLTWNHLFR